ncbi:MAG: helix-turn-helix domain-containing protein, partial [Chloroflexi bacterium]|nr:helix-turn-helix domain-containing protein [Chloroflexota bacterium]
EYKRMAAAAARVSELRARQEAARQKAEDSQPGTRSVIPTYEQSTYRYVAPLTQVEVLDWGERSAVLKVAGELHRWYKRHILGTKAWPGRREGSILLPNFPQLYPEMYRQLCSEMCKMAELPRALDVAAALGISEATFYNYLVRFHMAFPPDS